jgi:hypothetical protein
MLQVLDLLRIRIAAPYHLSTSCSTLESMVWSTMGPIRKASELVCFVYLIFYQADVISIRMDLVWTTNSLHIPTSIPNYSTPIGTLSQDGD